MNRSKSHTPLLAPSTETHPITKDAVSSAFLCSGCKRIPCSDKAISAVLLPLLALWSASCGKNYDRAELIAECKQDYKEVYQLNLVGTSVKRFFKLNASNRSDLWRAGSRAGIPEGQFLHAEYLRKVTGSKSDRERATKLYLKAAEQGNPLAIVRYAYSQFSGIGTPVSLEESRQWLSKLYQEDDPIGICDLGAHHLWRDKNSGDKMLGIKYLEEALEKGSGWAGYFLGLAYEDGSGVAKDVRKAAEYNQQASKMGNRNASRRLAAFFEEGIGVVTDLNKSREYVALAADQGNGEMAHLLAVRYERGGYGLPKDPRMALQWCLTAATVLDHPAAMRSLGARYDEGRGVEKNLEQAFQWYQKAADRGEVQAIFNLAHYYLEGKGTRKHPKRAIDLFNQAIDKDFAPAMNSLGVIHIEGNHGDRNLGKARELWERGAKLGDENCRHNLLMLGRM